MELTYIIYKLYFKGDDRVYIGKTTRSLSTRRNSHIQHIKAQSHSNHLLREAMEKYGQDTMVLEEIEKCTLEQSKEREIYWINEFRATDNTKGYNLSAVSSGSVSFNLTEVQKQKISSAIKGRTMSEEHRERVRQANLGKKMSEEDKQKRRDWYKNVGGFTYEQREKMSVAASYKRSDETKSKMSNTREEKIANAKGMTLEEWRAYKENAVKYWIDNRESSSVVAKMFKVDKSMLYGWKAQYLEKLNKQE
jgi:group I intron endonuclease